VGATVTWINREDIPHTMVSSDAIFKSQALDTDENLLDATTSMLKDS
jgi:plastocyanin